MKYVLKFMYQMCIYEGACLLIDHNKTDKQL